MNLIETLIGVALLALAGVAAAGAILTGTHAVSAPAVRDLALASVRNAAVEARASAAYDKDAAAAILAAPAAEWTSSGMQFTSAVDDGALVLSASRANETAQIRYPVAAEALPQGTIVDLRGLPVAR